MGRRGQGPHRRLSCTRRPDGHQVPGRRQRRAYRDQRTGQVRAAHHTLGCLQPRDDEHRQRRHGRQLRHHGRGDRQHREDRRTQRRQRLHRPQGAPDHALPLSAGRCGGRQEVRRPEDRHDEARNRSMLQRQGRKDGPQGRRPPGRGLAQDAHRAAAAQEEQGSRVLRAQDVHRRRADGEMRLLEGAFRIVHHRLHAGGEGRRRIRQEHPAGGSARHHEGQRLGHLPLHHQLQPDRGRSLQRRGHSPEAHRQGVRSRQGLLDLGRRRSVHDRALRCGRREASLDRRRIRRHHGTSQTLRVARPGRRGLRLLHERRDRSGPHQARRPGQLRDHQGLHRLHVFPTRSTRRGRSPSTRTSPAGCATRRSAAPGTSFPRRRRITSWR